MKIVYLGWIVISLVFLVEGNSLAIGKNEKPVIKIGPHQITMEELKEEEPYAFYRLDKIYYDNVVKTARQKYLDFLFQQRKPLQIPSRRDYLTLLESQTTISEQQIQNELRRRCDNPFLYVLEPEDLVGRVILCLKENLQANAAEMLVEKGRVTEEFEIFIPQPREPRYKIIPDSNDIIYRPPDHLRIGDKNKVKSFCKINLFEYVDFKCHFCARMVEDLEKVLLEFRGQVCLITREYIWDFNEDARAGAIAWRCAAKQDKAWPMYKALFNEMQEFSETNLFDIAKAINLETKIFLECLNHSESIQETIDKNIKIAKKNGVFSTPTFFLNGKRINGVMEYQELKDLLTKELFPAKGGEKKVK